MNKNRFYIIIIIGLLISNILLVFFMNSSGPLKHPKRHHPKRLIIKRLNFDDSQIKLYEDLVLQHQSAIRRVEEQINMTKKELYKLLLVDENQQRKNSLINSLADYKKEIERVHFDHFLEIKQLCREDQRTDFNYLSEELVRLFDKRMTKR